MTDIDEKLIDELEQEMNSAVDYHDMAVDMQKSGCKECAFFMDMAKDEMLHAKWIYEYLDGKSISITENVLERYKELEAAHKFRG